VCFLERVPLADAATVVVVVGVVPAPVAVAGPEHVVVACVGGASLPGFGVAKRRIAMARLP